MQDAGEQWARLGGPADVDHTGALKFVGEDVDDQLDHVLVEGPERAVDEYPRGSLQQDAGDRETELFVLTQFPIPTVGGIEQRCEAFKAEPVKCARKSALAENLGLQGVGEDFAQGSAGHVGCAARQIKYLFASRTSDLSRAPGP